MFIFYDHVLRTDDNPVVERAFEFEAEHRRMEGKKIEIDKKESMKRGLHREYALCQSK